MSLLITNLGNDLQLQHGFHAKVNRAGDYTVFVRFYILVKRIRKCEMIISTGITIPKHRWTGESIKGTNVLTQLNNDRLDDILVAIKDALHDLKKYNIKSVEELRLEIVKGIRPKITRKVRVAEKQEYLSKLTRHTLEAIKEDYLSKKQVSITYKKNFRLAIQKLAGWWALEKQNSLPTIDEINQSHMEEFKVWFMNQKGITQNTVSTYLNRLRTIFCHAVTQKIITESPIPKKGMIDGYDKGKQASLTVDELIRFHNIPDDELSESMKRVKYIFLFLCGTGMGYGELKTLTLSNISKEGNDLIITKDRNKTGIEFSILLSGITKQIYETHFEKSEAIEPFTDLPSIEYVTRKVKVLARMAGIDKKLTTYVGRKTFATQWIKEGNSVYYLQKVLGHTTPTQTMDYVCLDKQDLITYSKEAYQKSSYHGLVEKK